MITHTVHFLTLLAFYLGIKLPFEVVWGQSSTPPASGSAGLLGVGVPWIGAIKGGESGGWARYAAALVRHSRRTYSMRQVVNEVPPARLVLPTTRDQRVILPPVLSHPPREHVLHPPRTDGLALRVARGLAARGGRR